VRFNRLSVKYRGDFVVELLLYRRAQAVHRRRDGGADAAAIMPYSMAVLPLSSMSMSRNLPAVLEQSVARLVIFKSQVSRQIHNSVVRCAISGSSAGGIL